MLTAALFLTPSVGLVPTGSLDASRVDLGRRKALGGAAAAALGVCSWPGSSLAADVASATFTAGDARFLQPAFDEIKYLGVKTTTVGSIAAADGAVLPALRITYDANKLSYKRVVGAFWRSCDPTRSAEQGQFGDPGPAIIWVANDDERALAEKSRAALDRSTRFRSLTFGPMFKGLPILAEVRPLDGEFVAGPDADQGWYVSEPKVYEKARKKSGRTKWFEDAYKPVTVTACQKKDGEGAVCGFVYFPCSEENGCSLVMNGSL